MRSILLISLLFCSFTGLSQEMAHDAPLDSTSKKPFRTTCYSNKKCDPLFIVDGKRKHRRAGRRLKSEDLITVELLRDKDAVAPYGEEGKCGVIIITTKKRNRKNTNG